MGPIRNRVRTFCCCAILQAAVLIGIPMRPEQVPELMAMLNQPKVAQTNPDRTNDGDADARQRRVTPERLPTKHSV